MQLKYEREKKIKHKKTTEKINDLLIRNDGVTNSTDK